MAATYEPIASTTLGSDATVTFSGIAADWTDLLLVAHARSSHGSSNRYIGMRINSDTGTNYSMTRLTGSGSTSISGRTSNATFIDMSGIPGNTATANVFGVVLIHIMSYANTNVFKTVLASANSATHTDAAASRTVGLWRSTSAITSVSLSDYGNSVALETGTTVSLYGIKAA